MTKRHPKQGPHADDFREAKNRLKDIGSGLSSVFDAVSHLIDEASRDGDAGAGGKAAPGKRFTSSFDVRVRTLDELSEARAPKAKPAAPRRAKAQPAAAEHHLNDDGVMVVVTLGPARPQDIALVEGPTGAALICGTWCYAITDSAPLDLPRADKTLRNGYLTFHIPYRAPASGGDTEE